MEQAEGLGAAQIQVIGEARAYLRRLEARGIDVASDGLSYLCTFAAVPGHARLRLLTGGWRYLPKFIVALARDIVRLLLRTTPLVANGGRHTAEYDQLVISWAKVSDFQSDGSYVDRYFRTNSREAPRALWFLVSLDDIVPTRLDPNIRLFIWKNRPRKLDFEFIAKTFATALRASGGSPGRLLHSLSLATVFAREIGEAVSAQLRSAEFRTVVLPYEAQPFHQSVFRSAKAVSDSIVTMGYLHSSLPALPTSLIYRDGAPDILLVHGEEQANMLQTHLGWPRAAIRIIPSLRYRAGDSGSFAGKIFLPYFVQRPGIIIDAFDRYLAQVAPASLPPLIVQNHPVQARSRPHRRLKDALERAMADRPEKFSQKRTGADLSISIGSTASIIEALERGVEVIQISADPLFESYSDELWSLMKVEQVRPYVFRYALPAPGKYIELGREQGMFEKYCTAQ